MRILSAIVFVMMLAGCSYGHEHVELMLDNPPGMLEDSLYVNIQDQLAALESRYLNSKITYAEYMEKKKELESNYQREADRRSVIVEGN